MPVHRLTEAPCAADSSMPSPCFLEFCASCKTMFSFVSMRCSFVSRRCSCFSRPSASKFIAAVSASMSTCCPPPPPPPPPPPSLASAQWCTREEDGALGEGKRIARGEEEEGALGVPVEDEGALGVPAAEDEDMEAPSCFQSMSRSLCMV